MTIVVVGVPIIVVWTETGTAVDRAGVAEQPAVLRDEPRGVEAAVEAGGDPGRAVGVAGEQADGRVVAGLAGEVDRHRAGLHGPRARAGGAGERGDWRQYVTSAGVRGAVVRPVR